MKILISGSSGLIGNALVDHFVGEGHKITRLVRVPGAAGENSIFWNPSDGNLDEASVEGFDAVINLSGYNIGSGKWTAKRKALIRDSRIDTTRLLANTLAALNAPPRVFVSSSAIGIYGNRGDTLLTEDSEYGSDFLADVCLEWEDQCKPAVESGIRTVNVRTGMVIAPDGGAIPKMLTPFKLGLGGKLGSGTQYISWISLDDVIGGVAHILNETRLSGPVNFVAPNPVTNAEFTKALGKALKRPTFMSVPASSLRLIMGEMADAMLLSSTRVSSSKLEQSGYQFRHPTIEMALSFLS